MYTEPPEDEREIEPEHGPDCAPKCAEDAALSPIHRTNRPPQVRCPFCRAEPGMACHLSTDPRRRLIFGGPHHPSRLELIA